MMKMAENTIVKLTLQGEEHLFDLEKSTEELEAQIEAMGLTEDDTLELQAQLQQIALDHGFSIGEIDEDEGEDDSLPNGVFYYPPMMEAHSEDNFFKGVTKMSEAKGEFVTLVNAGMTGAQALEFMLTMRAQEHELQLLDAQSTHAQKMKQIEVDAQTKLKALQGLVFE